MKKGFNNFDILYYINIDHRTDRKQQLLNELSKTNIDFNKINRIDAIHTPHFGQLGCSKSHIKALEMFLKTDDTVQNCLILEDDFEFILSIDEINIMIDNFFYDIKNFDVLMLSYNNICEANERTDFHYLIRILDNLSMSGYCVSKKYAKRLLDNYVNGVEKLNYHYKTFNNKVQDYYLDMYNRQLINNSLWFGFIPKIGKQRLSYSDIENKIVDYNV